MGRMERTLTNAARYWGRKPRRRIECYVVEDLDNWPPNSLPHPLARVIVGGVSGATIGSWVNSGREAHRSAVVYASSERGVAEHEIVHAYCSQNFGTSGPYWYKEGMAEMAVLSNDPADGICCNQERLDLLRAKGLPTVEDVVTTGEYAARMSKTMTAMLDRREDRQSPVSEAKWTSADRRDFDSTRNQNLSCWLFCYMLHHNPNYSERFRSLGVGYLASRDSFQELFGAMRNEIAFEYDFLMDRVGPGFRVDLCSWDWNAKFHSLEECTSVDARVSAAAGFQPSGVMVQAGKTYAYRADGNWSLSDSTTELDADGDLRGQGVLVGIIMDDYRLSRPFVLGANGSFTAEHDGKLYLRCRDEWCQLDDNRGIVRVSFRHRYR